MATRRSRSGPAPTGPTPRDRRSTGCISTTGCSSSPTTGHARPSPSTTCRPARADRPTCPRGPALGRQRRANSPLTILRRLGFVPKTVLVVEDEPTLRETLAEALEAEGYRALQAGDGKTGLALFRSEHPDLVLLDLMLPELSGLEVTRQVRAESAVPIVMLTARDAEVDKVVGLELGADDYVTKPFSLREL